MPSIYFSCWRVFIMFVALSYCFAYFIPICLLPWSWWMPLPYFVYCIMFIFYYIALCHFILLHWASCHFALCHPLPDASYYSIVSSMLFPSQSCALHLHYVCWMLHVWSCIITSSFILLSFILASDLFPSSINVRLFSINPIPCL